MEFDKNFSYWLVVARRNKFLSLQTFLFKQRKRCSENKFIFMIHVGWKMLESICLLLAILLNFFHPANKHETYFPIDCRAACGGAREGERVRKLPRARFAKFPSQSFYIPSLTHSLYGSKMVAIKIENFY